MICHNRTTAAVLGRCFLALISVVALERNLSAEPRVYTGIVVTDVRVGTTLMHNASLTITFQGDTNDILSISTPSQECAGTGYFSYLAKGIARMQIEYQGRTHQATLQNGQLFVSLDACSGGIGFGAFIGPNGMEIAYPFALTLGTAEYASLADSSPLTGTLSTTGSAWSCMGFPPGGIDALPGTSTGNCIPPDSYPLKSDIGDIFVYQPYYEYDFVGDTSIASNHSGSTNRGAFLVRPNANGTLLASLGPLASAHGSGVVYTLQTVADGSIGGHVFNQALVTLQMISDAKLVTSRPSPANATKALYENRIGIASVTVDDGGDVIAAVFVPGEVYVRYDTGAGVAGFGSPISPTYPVAIGCSDSAYPSDSSYTADCLQGELWDFINSGKDADYIFRAGILAQLSYPVAPSAGVHALPQSLSKNTLLTGTAHTCAGVYTIGGSNPDGYFPGDLGVCARPAPRGLHTSKGMLFLQDSVGGTLLPANAAVNLFGAESGSDGGWDLANSGFLHVEVY